PDTNTTTDARTTSTVPLQALYLMNHPFVHEQAQGFARRLMAGSPDARQRVQFAYQLALGRPPAPDEGEAGCRYVARYEQELAALGVRDASRELETWTGLTRTLLAANE